MRIYIREFVWVAVAQAATFAGGLAMVKASAVVLGPLDYGKLAVSLAVVGIIQVCLYGAIAQTATRFFALAARRGARRRYEICLAGLVGAVFLFTGLLSLVAVVTGLNRHLPVSIGLLAAFAIVTGTQAVLTAIFNAGRRRQIVAAVQVVDALLKPAILLLIVSSTTPSADHALIAYVVSTSVVLALSVTMYFWGRQQRIAADQLVFVTESQLDGDRLVGRMIAFGLPFLVFGLLGVIGSHGERLLLANWATWSEVGSYALMAQLVMAPNVLFTAVINQFYYPLVFQHDASGAGKIARSLKIYLLVTILGVVATTVTAAVFGPLLISLFSTKAFLGHEHLLWYLGLSAGLFCVAQQLVLPGLRVNRPAVYMPAKFAHSAALFGCAFVLVPRWGIDGMGAASTLSALIYLIAILAANTWLRKRGYVPCP